MTKHEIDIPGLPDGWRAVAYRPPCKKEKYVFEDEIHTAYEDMAYSYLIVEKIRPRRIVLEETGDKPAFGDFVMVKDYGKPDLTKAYRVVE